MTMALLDLQGLGADLHDGDSDRDGRESITVDSVLSLAICV
jgi:hypothetical protein